MLTVSREIGVHPHGRNYRRFATLCAGRLIFLSLSLSQIPARIFGQSTEQLCL